MKPVTGLVGISLVFMGSGAWAKCEALGKHDPAALKYICDSERAWAESVASGD